MAKHWGSTTVPEPCPACNRPAIRQWAPHIDGINHVEWYAPPIDDDEAFTGEGCSVCGRGHEFAEPIED